MANAGNINQLIDEALAARAAKAQQAATFTPEFRGRGRGRGRGAQRGAHRGEHRGAYRGTARGHERGGYRGNHRGHYQGGHRGGYQGSYQGGYSSYQPAPAAFQDGYYHGHPQEYRPHAQTLAAAPHPMAEQTKLRTCLLKFLSKGRRYAFSSLSKDSSDLRTYFPRANTVPAPAPAAQANKKNKNSSKKSEAGKKSIPDKPAEKKANSNSSDPKKTAKKRPREPKKQLAIIFVGRLDYYGIKKENREQVLDQTRKTHSLNAFTISGAWLDTHVRSIEQWKVKVEMNVVNSEAESCVVVYLPNPEEGVEKLEENIEAIRKILGPKLKFEVGFNIMTNSCTPRTLKKEAEEKMNADEDAGDTDKFVSFLEKRKAVSNSYASNLIDGHDVYSLQTHDDPFRKDPATKMDTFFSYFVKKMGHAMKPYSSLAKKDPIVVEKSSEDDAFDKGLRPSKKFKEMEEARIAQEKEAADDQKVTRERSDAFLGDFNKYLASNATATEAMAKAAERMAQSGSFMAEAATHLPKEIVQVQAEKVQMIDKNVNQVDNSLHQHAHLHAQPPPHGHQSAGTVARPSKASNMHSTTYSKEVERLRASNGLGGGIYEHNSRGERTNALKLK